MALVETQPIPNEEGPLLLWAARTSQSVHQISEACSSQQAQRQTSSSQLGRRINLPEMSSPTSGPLVLLVELLLLLPQPHDQCQKQLPRWPHQLQQHLLHLPLRQLPPQLLLLPPRRRPRLHLRKKMIVYSRSAPPISLCDWQSQASLGIAWHFSISQPLQKNRVSPGECPALALHQAS